MTTWQARPQVKWVTLLNPGGGLMGDTVLRADTDYVKRGRTITVSAPIEK